MNQEKTNKPGKDNTRIGAVIVLIISAIVFIPFGGEAVLQAFLSKNKAPEFGKYDGKPITYEPGTTFSNVVSNIAERYKSMGQDLNNGDYYRIFAYAFETTVKDMAYLEATKKAGYVVPESSVNRMLVKYYADAEGNYSPKIYNQTSKSEREQIRNGVEKTLAYNRYTEDLFGASSTNMYGLKVSSKEIPFLNDMGKDKHSFCYASFDTADFPKAEAVKWAKPNADKFTKYDMSVITLDDESIANTLLKQLKANEVTFEDAVSEKSQKYFSGSDGKLSKKYAYQFESLIEDSAARTAVTGLAKDSLSAVVKTSQGYSIFRCDAAAVSADLNDSTTQDVILSYVKSNESGYVENYYSEIAKNFITQAAATSFEEACIAFDVQKIDTLNFPVNYGNTNLYTAMPDNTKTLSAMTTDADALKKIFMLKTNEVSTPIVLGSSVAVFKCTGIMEDNVPVDAASLTTKIASTDSSSASQALMTCDKVENNVWAAYFSNFTDFN